VGVVAALALWLFLLHVVFLVGYRVALSGYQVLVPQDAAPQRTTDDELVRERDADAAR
jgi:hypothetical protein